MATPQRPPVPPPRILRPKAPVPVQQAPRPRPTPTQTWEQRRKEAYTFRLPAPPPTIGGRPVLLPRSAREGRAPSFAPREDVLGPPAPLDRSKYTYRLRGDTVIATPRRKEFGTEPIEFRPQDISDAYIVRERIDPATGRMRRELVLSKGPKPIKAPPLPPEEDPYPPGTLRGTMASFFANSPFLQGVANFLGPDTVQGKILGALDIPRQLLERVGGTGIQAIGSIVDPAHYGGIGEFLSNIGSAWEASGQTFETGAIDIPEIVFGLTPMGWLRGRGLVGGALRRVAEPLGIQMEQPTEAGKTWVDYDLPYVDGGPMALVELRRRMAAGESADSIRADVERKYGVPGMIRELGSGIVDPLNFIGFGKAAAGAINKGAAAIGKFGGVGRIGAEAALEFAEATRGAGGLRNMVQMYRNYLVGEKIIREGVDAAKDLGRLQKLIVGKRALELADMGTYVKPKWYSLLRLEPEAEAVEYVNQTVNWFATHVMKRIDWSQPDAADRAVAMFRALKEADPSQIAAITGSDALAKAASTIEFRALRRGLVTDAFDNVLESFKATRPDGDALTALAQSRKLKPLDLLHRMDDLVKAKDDAGLTRMLDEFAQVTGNPLRIGDQPATVKDLKDIVRMFGDKRIPIDAPHFQAALLSNVAEGAGEWASRTFRIKEAQSVLKKWSAASKAVQSPLMLGFNLGYLMQNMFNGFLTMGVDGVFGLRRAKTMGAVLSRMGLSPARYAQGIGIADVGDILDLARKGIDPVEEFGAVAAQAGLDPIRKASNYGGIAGKLRETGSRIMNRMPTSRLAQTTERYQSMNTTFNGIMQWVGMKWKRGIGFETMPRALEDALGEYDPRLVNAIYAAAESAGTDPASLAARVLEDAPRPVIERYFGRVAETVGVSDQDVARLMSEDGLGEFINDGLARMPVRASDGDVRKVFDSARDIAEDAHNKRMALSYEEKFKQATVAAQNGDLGELMSVFDDVNHQYNSTMMGHIDDLEAGWEKASQLTGGSYNVVVKNMMRRARRKWDRFLDYADSAYQGADNGLGLAGVKLDDGFGALAKSKRSRLEQFFDNRGKLLDDFTERAGGLDTAARRAEWDALQDVLEEDYSRMIDDLETVGRSSDEYISSVFERHFGEDTGRRFAEWRQAVRGFTKDEMGRTLAHRKYVRGLSRSEASKSWKQFFDGRAQRIIEQEKHLNLLSRRVSEVMPLVDDPAEAARLVEQGVPKDLARIIARKTFAPNRAAPTAPPRTLAWMDNRELGRAGWSGGRKHLFRAVNKDRRAAGLPEFARMDDVPIEEAMGALNRRGVRAIDPNTSDVSRIIQDEMSARIRAEYQRLNARLWEPGAPKDELNDISRRMSEIDNIINPVPPAPRTLIDLSNLPSYVADEIVRRYEIADRLGLVDDIERLAFEGKVAGEITGDLIDRFHAAGMMQHQGKEIVRGVRARLGIPSRDDATEFLAWQNSVRSRIAPSARGQLDPGQIVPQTNGDVLVGTEAGDVRILGYDDTGVKAILPDGDEATVMYRPDGDPPFPPTVMADEGSRPTPYAEGFEEMYDQTIRPMLDQMETMAIEDVGQPAIRGAQNLPPELRDGVMDWLRKTRDSMPSMYHGALKWGEFKRDQALLNYGRRYLFDTYLGAVAPYEFWTTHSVIRWALRTLDNPMWAAHYYRLNNLFNTAFPREGQPSRLQGKVKIPIPFMPDWMGGGLFIDPLRMGLPFQNWTYPWEDWSNNQSRLTGRAESILNKWIEEGIITPSQADQAALKESGELWDRAVAEAQEQDPGLKRDFFDLASGIYAPSLPLSLAYQALRGTPEKIGPLPLTRYVRSLSTMIGFGGPGGFNIEAPFRRALGLPTFDQWADYRIDRELSNMAAEGLITSDQATEAMISRSGEIFDRAMRREAEEAMWRTLAGGALGMSGDVYPEGERTQRELALLFKATRDAEANGDTNALDEFFQRHPEFEARLALYDDKEDRIRNFLIDKMWGKWKALPRVYRDDIQQAFGEEFSRSFLDMATRDYKTIPVDTLQRWAVTMGQYVPGSPDVKPIPVDWAPPEVAQAVEQFYAVRDQLFDMDEVGDLWDQYFEIPEDAKLRVATPRPVLDFVSARDQNFPGIMPIIAQYNQYEGKVRSAFKKANPVIGSYFDFVSEWRSFNPDYKKWVKKNGTISARSVDARDSFFDAHPVLKTYSDWKKDYLGRYPLIQPYLDEVAQRAKAGEFTRQMAMPSPLPPDLYRLASAYVLTGRGLSPAVQKQLRQQYEASGVGVTFNQWMNGMVAFGPGQGTVLPPSVMPAGQAPAPEFAPQIPPVQGEPSPQMIEQLYMTWYTQTDRSTPFEDWLAEVLQSQ